MQNYEHAKKILTEDYNDNNFCTVVSIATAFDWSAGKAFRLLAKHGRVKGRGPAPRMYTKAVLDAAKIAGKKATIISAYDNMTINRFVKERKVGTYMVLVKGHALTVKDGEIMDWTAKTAGRRKIGYRSYFVGDNGSGHGGVIKIED